MFSLDNKQFFLKTAMLSVVDNDDKNKQCALVTVVNKTSEVKDFTLGTPFLKFALWK